MNDYDASLWPTRHLTDNAPYILTRGDQVGILLTQIDELHHALAELRRLNGMLNDQLRTQREQRQLQEQPAPQPVKPKVRDIST